MPVLFILLLTAVSCPKSGPPADTAPTGPSCFDTIASPALEPVDAKVVSVQDGDTLTIDRNLPGPEGDTNVVRLTCVEAPEVPDECYGNAAGAWLRERLEGQTVHLVFDQSLDCAYGRVCAWVQLDGQTMNVDIVRAGYGVLYSSYRYEHSCCDLVEEAEDAAAAEALGGWTDCTDFGGIDTR